MADGFRPLDASEAGMAEAHLSKPWGTYRPSMLQAFLIGLTRRTFLQRGKLREHMTNLICGMGRPLDIRFRGLNMQIEGVNNLIENGVLTRPSYNGTEIDFLCAGLGPGDVAVDIGCNNGMYTLSMAQAVGDEGRVLAIDANAQMVQTIAFHAEANGLQNIMGIALAVGDQEAKVDLKVRRDDVAIVMVQEAADGAVQMQPLASIVRGLGVERVKALKIDIEGHEDKALVPYFETVAEPLWPDRIVIEFSPPDDYPGCAAIFKERGYRLVGRTRNNSMYLRG